MATRRAQDLVPGTLDMLILKTLSLGSNHGYGIASRIRQVSDLVLQVEEGSLYPALHRLEKKKLIKAEWGRSESNRRARYYHLTVRGEKQLRTEESSWAVMSEAIARVLSAQPADVGGTRT